MIMITASEKQEIVKKHPNVHIVRTMKQRSKRHHYYMEEDRNAMRTLKIMRGEYVPSNKKNRNRSKPYNRYNSEERGR